MAEGEEAENNRAEAEESGKSGGGTKNLIIAVAAGVVLLLGGMGVGVVLFGSSHEQIDEGTETTEGSDGKLDVSPTHDGGEEAHEGAAEQASHGSDGSAPEEYSEDSTGRTYQLESFIVNISDRERDRYLKLKAEIEYSSERVSAEIDGKLPHIRDMIISVLGNKSFEEIRSMEGKDLLREELLHRINALLTTGKARRVFFTEFVVQ
jgi:flagellar FliL protein